MREQDLTALASKTQDIYTRHGEQFDRERAKTLFEKPWLDRFLALMSSRGTILDVGCGAGEPIAQYFIEQGFKVTGVDFSPSLIEIAQKRFPDHRWIVGDMRALNLKEQFDGLIAWHSFFHLTADEQRATLAAFANHLTEGGVMMLTVGPEEGEVVGHVGGDPVYHASLSFNGYKQALQDLGMEMVRFVPEDPECDYASVLLARKQRQTE